MENQHLRWANYLQMGRCPYLCKIAWGYIPFYPRIMVGFVPPASFCQTIHLFFDKHMSSRIIHWLTHRHRTGLIIMFSTKIAVDSPSIIIVHHSFLQLQSAFWLWSSVTASIRLFLDKNVQSSEISPVPPKKTPILSPHPKVREKKILMEVPLDPCQ